MSATDPPATDADRRNFIERIARGASPQQIRTIAEQNFILASNILTYNWIEGNPRADWDGKPFEWHPVASGDGHHYGHWYDQIRANALNMFLAARKHTKTTFACCLMICESEFTPGHSSLYWANTEGQVEERMEELEEIADANPWLEYVHGDGALKSKTFDNGARILTTWVTGAFEGGHVDLMLGDDPMKELGDISDSDIESWYGQVIVPVLNPDGMQAIIGTRKRPKDLYYILRQKHKENDFPDDIKDEIPSYTLTEYPAIREAWKQEYDRPHDLAPEHLYTKVQAEPLAKALDLPDDELSILWPEARDPNFLARNLGGQGRPYFLREFCMIFTQAEDAIVHRNWIDATAADRRPPATLGAPWQPAAYPDTVTRDDFSRVVTGIDPAGKGGDRFGFVTIGELEHAHNTLPPELRALAVDDDGDPMPLTMRHVLDVWQAVDVPPSRFREKLSALYDRYRPDAIAIESNLNQTWVVDDEEIPPVVQSRIEPIATSRAKHSWKDGVPGIASDIESGKYRWYTGGDDGNMTTELITAFTTIQMDPDTGELVGHTPDLVMAHYMADRALAGTAGSASSTRTSLSNAGDSEDDERTEREKRNELKQSALGRQILDSRKQRFGGY